MSAIGARLRARFATPVSAAAVIVAIAATSLVPVVLVAGSADAVQSTGGTARFPNVQWISWGASGAALKPDASGNITKTTTMSLGGQTVDLSCTMNNLKLDGATITSASATAITAYKSGTWQGDGLDELYNIGGTGASNTLVAGIRSVKDGGTVTFDLACSATVGAAKTPITLAGLVFANAESSVSANVGGTLVQEYISATIPAAGTWRILDYLRGSACTLDNYATVSGSGAKTLKLGGAATDDCEVAANTKNPNPMSVAYMDGVSSATNVTLRGRGYEGIAIGAVINADFGDAPASYGTAGALSQGGFNGGLVTSTAQAVSTMVASGLAQESAPALRLGTNLDFENDQQSNSTATGDDTVHVGPTVGVDDEDSVAMPATVSVVPGGTYTLSGVSCTAPSGSPGAVAGWIDWNGDGAFDATDRSAVAACAGTTTVNLVFQVPATAPLLAAVPTFARIRIAPNGVDPQPTGLVLTGGEVEDYATTVQWPELPSMSLTKTLTSGVVAPGQTLTYGLSFTNTGNVALSTVVVTDPTATTSGCTFASVAAHATVTCTATHAITGADMTAGSVTNTATVNANDNHGVALTPVTSSVTVRQVPAASNDSATTASGVTVTRTAGTGVLANDFGHTLAVTPAVVNDLVKGQLTLLADGSYTFVPVAGFSGVFTYVYTATDGFGTPVTATLTITVNAPPVAGNAATSVNPDVNAVLTPTITPGTGAISTVRFADGTISKTVAGQGTWTLTGAGTGSGSGAVTATFDPLPAFRGVATQQSYIVTDVNALTATGTLNVTVRTGPTAGSASATVNPDVNAVLTPTVTAGTGVVSTVRFADGSVSKTVAGQGTWTLTGAGTGSGSGAVTATFDPLPAFRGVATQQSYIVTDVNALTATGTLDVTVRTGPTAGNASATVNPDINAVLTPAIAAGTGAVSTVTFADGSVTKAVAGQGTWTLTGAGTGSGTGAVTATFDPLPAFRGVATQQSYLVTDVFGVTASGTLDVTVRTGPSAGNASTAVNPDVNAVLTPAVTAGTGAVSTVRFADGSVTKTVAGQGTWTLTGAGTGSGSGAVTATFDPLPAFRGGATQQSYVVTDVNALTATGTLDVTVRTGPTASNVSTTVDPDVTVDLVPTVGTGTGAVSTVRFADGSVTKTVAGQGTWTLTGAGTGSGSGAVTATFDPLPAFRGVASQQTYVVTDVFALTASGTLDVTVRTGPTAGNASTTVDPDVTVTLNPVVTAGTGAIATATFADGSTTKTVSGQGTWTISLVSGQPVVVFDPLPSFRGAATQQSYVVTDVFALAATGTVDVTVRTGPSAGSASAAVNPDVNAVLTPAVTAGTGAVSTVRFADGTTSKTVAGQGTWTLTGAGTGSGSGAVTATFDPLPAFRGAATQQSYVVTDVNSLTATGTLDVTVRTGPTASSVATTVNPDVTVDLTPTIGTGTGAVSTVTFADGSVTKTVAGQGTWTLTGAGTGSGTGAATATFDPLPAFRGVATQQGYVVTDVFGLTATGAFDVTVRTGPTATSASATVNPDVTATLNPVVTAGTGAVSTATFADGSVSKTVAGEGTWTISLVSGQPEVVFDPLPAFGGAAAQQSYVVTDVFGLTDTGTLDVTVRTGPTAGNSSATVNPDITTTLNPVVTAGTGAISTATFADGSTTKTVPTEGTWTISLVSGQPEVVFDPLPAFGGVATQQSYIVTDVNGLTATGTLDVTVESGPAAGDASATVNPDVTATLNPTVGTGTGALVSVTFADGSASKTVPGEGTWTISLVSGQPEVMFDPLPGFRGAATQQTYLVTDVNGLTDSGALDVTVRTGPTAGDSSATVNPDVTATLNPVVTAGTGAVSTATFADGSTTKTVPTEGTWTISLVSGQPEVVFDPLPAFRGAATQQSYEVTDVNDLTATGTLDVTVRTGPTAGDSATTVNPDVTATLHPVVTAGTGAVSTATFADGSTTKTVPTEGTWTISLVSGQPEVVFDPLPAFRGAATQQSYEVTDAFGLTATGTLDVTVRTGPTAGSAATTVNPDVTATLNPVVAAGTGALSTVTFADGSTSKSVAGEGTWTISLVSGQPEVMFDPLPGFRGAATQQSYEVTDVNDLTATGTLDVTVRTSPATGDASVTVNPGATATLNPVTTPGTGSITGVLFDNDATSKTVSGEGTWTVALVSGQPEVTFEPEAGFTGLATSQTYTVTDEFGITASGNLSVTVRTPPSTGDDSATVNPGVTATLNPVTTPGTGSITGVLFDNDATSKSVSGEGTWTVSLVAGQPVINFDPEVGFTGAATPQAYTVTDQYGLTASGTLNVTVRSGPVADDASATVNPDVTATLNPTVITGTGVLAGVTFADGSASKTVTGEGTWTITLVSGQPEAVFDPLSTFTGVATQQTYVVTDVNDLTDTGTLDVTVRTAPTTADASTTVNPGVTATLNPVTTPGTGSITGVLFDNNAASKTVSGEGTWTVSLGCGSTGCDVRA